MKQRVPHFLPLAVLGFLASCASHNYIDKAVEKPDLPAAWQVNHSSHTTPNTLQSNGDTESSVNLQSKQALANIYQGTNWVTQFGNQQLVSFVKQALDNNHQLKQLGFALESAKQSLLASGSTLWPELDLDFQTRRSKASESGAPNSNHSLSLNLSYELDLWGKLSANERSAHFSYLAEKANFEQQKQQLVVDVLTTWLAVVEANNLLELYQKQAENSKQNIAIIEAGYQSGLSAALDVYLTRNDLNNALAQIASQQATQINLVRKLERLLGLYPAGTLVVDAQFPTVSGDIELGLPSELLARKSSLKASWYQLLAKDASLAFAHKQRFPSIRFSAGIDSSSKDIGEVFSPSELGWSLLGGISQPLFYGGRLAANEARALAELKQTEQKYLDNLYSALNNVENSLSTEQSLKVRYQTTLAAQENAQIAATLSFEQYQSGLVSYTTALDAQTRSYNAQSSLIQIQNQLIENRINLHLNLGGDFSTLPNSNSDVGLNNTQVK